MSACRQEADIKVDVTEMKHSCGSGQVPLTDLANIVTELKFPHIAEKYLKNKVTTNL
jgi:hypothetical protein